jgi:transposase InsO family protein
VKFTFIRDHRSRYDVKVMCRVFAVSQAGFHAWLARPLSNRAARAHQLAEQIRLVHEENYGIYGSIKVTRELAHRKIRVNRKTVAKIMNSLGIRSRVKRKFRIRTTDSNHANPVAPNILNRNFDQADAPNKVWATDITYIHTDEGVLYLAGVMDLCSRKIVGWSLDSSMTAKLVTDAFNAAVLSRQVAFGLLHHSDRGVQYTSRVYRQLLEDHGVKVSMSRTGDCYDNAVIESFWGKLKCEMINHHRFATKAQARAKVFEYIEMFYNRTRRHAALGYVSPVQFEECLPR